MRSWILGIGGAAVFCAVATELTPKGAVRKIVGSLCGIVMAMALISPLLEIDLSAYSVNLASYRNYSDSLGREGGEISAQLNRRIIESECRTYILDKAELLGLDAADAGVELRWSSDGFWYPVRIFVDCGFSPELSAVLESELGVARECQTWRSDENN